SVEGRRIRELAARDLHPVAGVPAEADDGPVEGLFLARRRDGGGHAKPCPPKVFFERCCGARARGRGSIAPGRRRSRLECGAVPRLRLTVLMLLFAPLARPEPIRVQAVRVGLSPQRPAVERVGALVYRGGLMLSSPDRRFGGFSGLLVSKDGGRLRAVSDEGSWLEARLVYDSRGFLAGLTDAQLGPLRDPEGQPLKEKLWQDAESLTA